MHKYGLFEINHFLINLFSRAVYLDKVVKSQLILFLLHFLKDFNLLQ